MTLSPDEFGRIRDIVYAHAGIRLQESRVDGLSRRVDARMRALDLRSAWDYLRYLRFDPDGGELVELIEMIVVGETYFFRDHPQLGFLAEEVLPVIVGEKGRSRKLAVLCAGCATGEEPYTIAIILREMLDEPDEWSLLIDGVDINGKVLSKAREAVYTPHALRETPYAYRDRYFTRQEEAYVLDPDIRRMVRFMKVNLFDPVQMRGLLFTYDIVLCKNVLIYFDQRSAESVLEHLYAVMNPEAFIFLGAAESLARRTTLFEMVRLGHSFAYRK